MRWQGADYECLQCGKDFYDLTFETPPTGERRLSAGKLERAARRT